MIDHSLIKEQSVTGRYVTVEHLNRNWFQKHKELIIENLGKSVLGAQIKGMILGSGPRRILMWSQMHGNESTTTKAVLDLVNFLTTQSSQANCILDSCSLCIIPILNPDGAKLYTRENANGVDLNRDAKKLTQPESRILRDVFEQFKPGYCFNLHDQRSLFGVGKTNKPATVSFLSPSSDPDRKITPARAIGMRLIGSMNNLLQLNMPGQVGRYDDSFNENCVGDTFQMLNVPTILFEAGHSPDDYERETTREHIFRALLNSIEVIGLENVEDVNLNTYFNIPENNKSFYDILIKNPYVINSSLEMDQDIGIRYKEVLKGDKIHFIPELASVERLDGYFGHWELDCKILEERERLISEKQLLELVSSAEKK